MINAILDTQLMITVNNKAGTLAEVTSVIAASKINLIAICAYTVNTKCVMSLEASELLSPAMRAIQSVSFSLSSWT